MVFWASRIKNPPRDSANSGSPNLCGKLAHAEMNCHTMTLVEACDGKTKEQQGRSVAQCVLPL